MSLLALPGLLLTLTTAAATEVKTVRISQDPNGRITHDGKKYEIELQGEDSPNSGAVPLQSAAPISAFCNETPPNPIAAADCTAILNGLHWTKNGSEIADGNLTKPLEINDLSHPVVVTVVKAGAPNVSLKAFTVKAAGASPVTATGTTSPAGTPPPDVTCDSLLGLGTSDLYSASDNSAQIVVSETGNVLRGLLSQFDEDDTLTVHVLTSPDRKNKLIVRRISEMRDLGAYRIINGGGISHQSLSACEVATVVLHDFEPGKGQIEISLRGEDGKLTQLSLVEFNVHALYRGMISFGGVWTSLPSPAFGTVSSPEGTVITRGEVGSHRLLYAVLFTPFVWGRRDMEKEPSMLSQLVRNRQSTNPESILRHFNPTLGVVVNDPLKNALAGVSLDLFEGVVISGGVHVGRVTVIDPRSGLAVGSIFDGPADQIPTAQRWQVSPYWSVSLDIRAVLQLLGAAVGAPGRQ